MPKNLYYKLIKKIFQLNSMSNDPLLILVEVGH